MNYISCSLFICSVKVEEGGEEKEEKRRLLGMEGVVDWSSYRLVAEMLVETPVDSVGC